MEDYAENPDLGIVTTKPVWTPGERFLDMDGDSRWDCLDESSMTMDCLTTSFTVGDRHSTITGLDRDGFVDAQMPWVDWNTDGLVNEDNLEECVIPRECTPGGCLADDQLTGGGDDGNSPHCNPFPIIGDKLPEGCDEYDPDNPTACIYPNSLFAPSNCPITVEEDEVPCCCVPVCCEFDDINFDGLMDITEPFEDFMRRWEPCVADPDATFSGSHWIKTYDPASPNAGLAFSDLCTLEQVGLWITGQANYGDTSYIVNNYPGPPGDVDPDGPPVNSWPNQDQWGSGILGRTNNGFYDSPDSWTNKEHEDTGRDLSTKLIVEAGPNFATITPVPGWSLTGGSPGVFDEPWYEQAWNDRYFYSSDPPAWPMYIPPEPSPGGPPMGYPAANAPMYVPFAAQEGEDPELAPGAARRFFQANRGGVWGNGVGWVGIPINDRFIRFETTGSPGYFDGPGGDESIPILPEEANGADQPPIFYDGYVEHDDLASSKYHGAGDQRLGEITSPFYSTYTGSGDNPRTVPEIWGHDMGAHDGSAGLQGDQITVAAGPYATTIFGDQGWDAGNVMMMEFLTRRIDGSSPSYGIMWEAETSESHPFAGLGNPLMDPNALLGFRDFNLDGLMDQGQVRPAGSENYIADAYATTLDNGVFTVYPWNRRRLVEDVIEALDYSFDFDLFVDSNSMMQVTGGSPPSIDQRDLDGAPLDPLVAEGFLSGTIMLAQNSLPPGATLSPGFYPIHNNDNDNRESMLPPEGYVPGETVDGQVSWNLWFHDLVVDAGGASGEFGAGSPVETFQAPLVAHEYGHAWQHWPDLYDYDVYAPPGPLINYPIGLWDIMAHGGLVHPVPPLKAADGTDWIDPIGLRTVLTPGVAKTLTLPPAELTRDASYYYFQSHAPWGSPSAGERFYFWSVGRGFDVRMPGEGLLILHTDLGGNDEALPPQQLLEGHFAYAIVQADGLEQMDAGINRGDAGDPFPGSTGNTVWNETSDPDNKWWLNVDSGISFVDVADVPGGGSVVKFVWNPVELPNLEFVDPPGGESVDGIYQVRYNARDQFGGTTMKFYWVVEGDAYDPLSFPTTHLIATATKPPGTVLGDSIDWDIDVPEVLPERTYHIFAKLTPGEGEDGQTENSFIGPFAGRANAGDAGFDPATITVDLSKSKLQSWILTKGGTAEEDPGTGKCTPGLLDCEQTGWMVVGTLSGVQTAAGGTPCAPRYAQQGTSYTTNGGELAFTIPTPAAGDKPFACGDSFVIATTGFTKHSAGVWVNVDGVITEAPTAIISADPLFGPPPLTVAFEALSEDPNNEPMTHTWDFGDGSATEDGEEVEHEYELPGTWTVTLTSTNVNTGAFGQASVDILVLNDRPTAEIEASPPYISRADLAAGDTTVHFDGSGSHDPECDDEPGVCLTFDWDFGDETPGSDLVELDHVFALPDGAEAMAFDVSLTVTDQGGTGGAGAQSHTATMEYWVGNAPPTATLSASKTFGAVPLDVHFRIVASDEDGDTLKYTWDFGDGKVVADATLPEIDHTYASGGVFNATVTVSDFWNGEKLTSIKSNTVVITAQAGAGEGPTARISIDPESGKGEVPFEVTFDASESTNSEGGKTGLKYAWNFGDGSKDSGVEVTYTFRKAGTYTVRLTVTDTADGKTGSATVSISATGPEPEPGPGAENQPPTADFSFNMKGLAPLTVEFESLSTDPDDDELTCAWVFGDDETDTGSQVTHAYAEAGTYLVELTVTDPDGSSDSTDKEVPVRINSAPVARIATPPGMVAEGEIEVTAPDDIIFDANLSWDENGDALTFTWTIEQDDDSLAFGTELAGARLLVWFRNTGSACDAAGDPCLTPGTYEIYVTADDGYEVSPPSDRWLVRVRAGQGAGGEAPAPEPVGPDEGRTLSGSTSVKPRTLCGVGMQLPLLFATLATAAMMVTRRRRW